MSHLLVKQKPMNKLKIQESEILESIQGLKQRIFRSDLASDNKSMIDDSLNDIESAIKNYFTIEYIKTKKIGNS